MSNEYGRRFPTLTAAARVLLVAAGRVLLVALLVVVVLFARQPLAWFAALVVGE